MGRWVARAVGVVRAVAGVTAGLPRDRGTSGCVWRAGAVQRLSTATAGAVSPDSMAVTPIAYNSTLLDSGTIRFDEVMNGVCWLAYVLIRPQRDGFEAERP